MYKDIPSMYKDTPSMYKDSTGMYKDSSVYENTPVYNKPPSVYRASNIYDVPYLQPKQLTPKHSLFQDTKYSPVERSEDSLQMARQDTGIF